jgi:outer membrane protein OmpA-like peptidoglycan-associated protein/tetratricopeptide (TPR) repeat protein
MKKEFKIIFVFLMIFMGGLTHAQDLKSFLNKGDNLFSKNHYRKALPFFEQVLSKDPNNADALYKSGVCYLNRFSRPKGLVNIKKAFQLDSTIDDHMHYWLGRAYHLNYEFDSAIVEYKKYSTQIWGKDTRKEDMNKYISEAEYAKTLYAHPSDFVVQNLGTNINSSFSEHSPIATQNDSMLYFTTRRHAADSSEEKDGEPFEDIYFSKRLSDGTWSSPEHIHINTGGHDANVQLYENDTKMLLYRDENDGDFYTTTKIGDNQWTDPVPFEVLNTNGFESDAYITNDGKTVYFATNKYSKDETLDIYYAERLTDSTWSEHKKVGGGINTKYDEDAPFLTPDGKTMYFSSRGHNSMGGYDVFKSQLQAGNSWSTPVNLGFPINTPDDDIYFYYATSDDRAYMSSYRFDGHGEKDIYAILPIRAVYVNGTVLTTSGKAANGAVVTFTSLNTYDSIIVESTVGSGTYNNLSSTLLSKRQYLVEIKRRDSIILTDTLDVPVTTVAGTSMTYKAIVPDPKPGEDTIKTPVFPIMLGNTQKIELVSENTIRVYFNTNDYELTKESKMLVMNYLKDKKYKGFEVVGHTDNTGPDALNYRLSSRRAVSVEQYLEKQTKVDVKAQGKGETEPIATNDTPEGRTKNRRVEITIIK